MRKITVLSFISLDGVMQGPGSPDEDTSNDFTLGGWVAPYGDQDSRAIMQKQLERADLLLAGRLLISGRTIGLPTRSSGQVLMKLPNMYFLIH